MLGLYGLQCCPLTLRTSPSDYATFNQLTYFFIFNIRLPFGKGKTAKKISLYALIAELEWISAKYENVVKNSLTVISNDQGFKLFT